jgi:2-hydroxy-6-oxonona-2,4-dienedioate hydrolase
MKGTAMVTFSPVDESTAGTAFVEINGGRVAYEFLGESDADLVVLTPGGRFGKDVPGLRPLALALVDRGHRVLLWDRPNCGGSDVQFFGETESHMRAATLAELLGRLEVSPAVLAGGSGGARDSVLTAVVAPELVSGLAIWSVVGGAYSMLNLASAYTIPTTRAAYIGGIEAVLALPEWAALVEKNPRNRERFLRWHPDELVDVFRRWTTGYVPRADQTIPGLDDAQVASIRVPTLIVRGGADDIDHPPNVADRLHTLVGDSVLIDAPWPDAQWRAALRAAMLGSGNLFDSWVLLAPVISEFISDRRTR